MSITFRLACPILITPMMCLLVGVAAVQDSEPAAADTAGLLEKGFSNLPSTRRVTDGAGGALLLVGFAHVRAADRPQRRGPAFEHAHLAHAAAAVDAADRDALAAQA